MTIWNQNGVVFSIDVENSRLISMKNHSTHSVDIVIPYEPLKNCRIKSIERGFCEGIFGTINISDNITNISDYAFSNAHADEVIWSAGCKTIPKYCFFDSLIKKISNIENVEHILDFAFSLSMIEEVCWPSKCQTIPCGCFHTCIARDVKGIENVTSILESAFSYSKIEEIVWPSSCAVVPPVCFKGSHVRAISNLDGVTEIGYGAFNGACNLEKIDLSQAIISNIGTNAFKGIDRNKVILPYYLCEAENLFG